MLIEREFAILVSEIHCFSQFSSMLKKIKNKQIIKIQSIKTNSEIGFF
jgi:hypothetical protein